MKTLLRKHAFRFGFLVLVAIHFQTHASESDPYTYRNIPLPDQAPLIGRVYGVQLLSILYEMNHAIGTQSDRLSDQAMYNAFVRGYRPTLRVASGWEVLLSTLAIPGEWDTFVRGASDSARGNYTDVELAVSPWEQCIRTNDCTGWPKFTRLHLYPGESIFDEADYNFITREFLADTIISAVSGSEPTSSTIFFSRDSSFLTFG